MKKIETYYKNIETFCKSIKKQNRRKYNSNDRKRRFRDVLQASIEERETRCELKVLKFNLISKVKSNKVVGPIDIIYKLTEGMY